MQVERHAAMALARRRMPVLATRGGVVVREVRDPKDMPREQDDTGDAPDLEYHALRDPDGNWTRAGLEYAIRAGGSVMHHGAIIEKLEDLPDEDALAATSVQRLDDKATRISGEIAKLTTELARVHAQRDKAEEGARGTWKDFAGRAREEDKAEKLREKQRQEQIADNLAQSGEAGAVAYVAQGTPPPVQHGPQSGQPIKAPGADQAKEGHAGHGRAGHAAKDKDKEK